MVADYWENAWHECFSFWWQLQLTLTDLFIHVSLKRNGDRAFLRIKSVFLLIFSTKATQLFRFVNFLRLNPAFSKFKLKISAFCTASSDWLDRQLVINKINKSNTSTTSLHFELSVLQVKYERRSRFGPGPHKRSNIFYLIVSFWFKMFAVPVRACDKNKKCLHFLCHKLAERLPSLGKHILFIKAIG